MSTGKQGTELEGQYSCKDCGEVFMTLPELGTHSRVCEARKKRLEDEKRRAPPEGVYKEEADANRILREILEGHPDISPKHANEILSWAQLKGELHPFEVAHLLSNMRGISSQTASIVSQKYSVALQKAVSEGTAQIRMPLAFQPTVQPGQFPMISGPYQLTAPSPFYMPSGQPMVPGQPAGLPTPGLYLTREEYVKMEKEREEKSELTKLKERMEKMDKDFAGALQTVQDNLAARIDEGLKPREEKVVLPLLDEKGSPIVDSKTGEARTITVPSNMALYIMMGMRRGLAEEDIRKIIRDETKAPPAPPKVEETEAFRDLKSRLDGAVAKYDELKEKMDAEDRKRLEDTIKDLRDRIDTLMGRPAGEYKADEYRLLADAMNRLSGALEGRKPMETVERMLTSQGVSSARPPSEKAGEVERGTVLEELGRKGLVRTVIERRG